MIAREIPINFINNTPLSISIYSVKREAPHIHRNTLEIVYCLKGEITLSVTHERLRFRAGDLYIVNATDIHSIESTGQNDALVVSFYINALDNSLPSDSLLYELFVCQEAVISEVTETYIPKLKELLIISLYFYCFHPKMNFEIYTRLTQRIVSILVEYFPLFYFSTNAHKFLPNERERYDTILRYIRKNYREKITLTKLAEIVHCNPSYLSQFFNKYLNNHNNGGHSMNTLHDLINFVRVYEAETLLCTTDKNISDISYDCGFSDPKFLYRTFKEWFSRTPFEHKSWYEEYASTASPNHYYSPDEIASEIEHCISLNLSSLILNIDFDF